MDPRITEIRLQGWAGIIKAQAASGLNKKESFVQAELEEKQGAVYQLEEFDSEDGQWNEMGMWRR